MKIIIIILVLAIWFVLHKLLTFVHSQNAIIQELKDLRDEVNAADSIEELESIIDKLDKI